MLLNIHNLPATTRYGDIKGLLQSKCGLQNVILDNLVLDGNSKKVTVGVSEDADAAILVRKINGLYWNGKQLYVEDVRQQKSKLEQPYRSAISQVQQQADEFPTLNLQQNSSYDNVMVPNMAPGVQPSLAMYCAPGYNQVYGMAGSIDQMQNIQTAYMGMGGYSYPQNSMQMSQLGMTPQPQYLNQQDINQANVSNNWKDRYEQPPEQPSFGRSQGFRQSPQRDQPWPRESNGRARNDFDTRPVPQDSYADPWNESAEPTTQDDHLGRRPERPNERFSNRSNDRSVEFPRQPDDWQGRNEFSEQIDHPGISFEERYNNFSAERSKRNEFSGRPDVRQGRPNERSGKFNEFSGRPNERQSRPNEFSGRPNEHQGRPNEYSGRPNERQGRPNEFSGRPNERQGRPNEFSGRPNEHQGRPNEFSGRPNERHGRPNEFSGRPNERQGRPNEFSGRPNERQGRSNEFSGRPNERQGRPNQFSGRPKERQGRPNEFSGQRNERHGRPNEPSGRPNKRPSRLTEPSRPVLSKKPKFDRSADRSAFPPTENPNPRPFDPSRKRKRLDEAVPKASHVGQWLDSKPLTIKPALNQNDEELSEAGKVKISKQLRRHGSKKVVMEIYASQGIEDPDLITRQEVNKFVFSRMDELLGDALLVSPLECYDIYRNRYPSTEDSAALAQISAIIAARRETEPIGPETAVTTKPPVTPKPAFVPPPQSKRLPPKGPTKGEKQTLRRIKEAKVLMAQGKIPTFPNGDKWMMTKQKQEEKAGYIPEVEPPLNKAIDEEVGKIVKLFTDELKSAPSADLQRAYDTVDQHDLIDELTQNVTQALARRVTNHGLKMVRVFGSPKLPKRPELEQFLQPYGVVCLRKSQRCKLYTAAIDSYKDYDKLLTMGEAAIGDGIVLSFKPLHLVPKQRADQRQLKIMRKEMTDKMIDRSELNLLDKDWPAMEIKINAALEAEKAKKKAQLEEKRALEAEKRALEAEKRALEAEKPSLEADKGAQEKKAEDVAENKKTDDDAKPELTDEMDHAEDFIGADYKIIDEFNECDDDDIDNVDVDLDDECLEDY